MYVKSKITLNFNKVPTGTDSGILIGQIESFTGNSSANFRSIPYTIGKDRGEGELLVIMQGDKILNTSEEIQAAYDLVKNDIPQTGNEPQMESWKYALFVRLEMVALFLEMNPNISVSDFEIIE